MDSLNLTKEHFDSAINTGNFIWSTEGLTITMQESTRVGFLNQILPVIGNMLTNLRDRIF